MYLTLLDHEALLEKLNDPAARGKKPGRFCSFTCAFSDMNNAQHAACQAVNGVWCTLLELPHEKGLPCRVRSILRKAGQEI